MRLSYDRGVGYGSVNTRARTDYCDGALATSGQLGFQIGL